MKALERKININAPFTLVHTRLVERRQKNSSFIASTKFILIQKKKVVS